MVDLVTLPDTTERQVRFIEETEPGGIIDATIEKLRVGHSAESLLAAAGIAVSRSTELPPDHHGGPIHPVAGLHAVCHLANRLTGEKRFLPVVQNVALANKHIHSPEMGPTAMPSVEPLVNKSKDELIKGFADALKERKPRDAERHLVTLLPMASPGELLETLLVVGLPRNSLDDHYFLYPVYCTRALDDIGWEWASVLLRPPVRYLATHPMLEPIGEFKPDVVAESVRHYQHFDEVERLIDERDLTRDTLSLERRESEDDAVVALAQQIGAVSDIRTIGVILADAVQSGLSLQATAEALSAGGAMLFLRSHSGNPFDVHIHTGINARRYVLNLNGISLRTKLLTLLGWCLGTEVRYLNSTLRWSIRTDSQTIASLPKRNQSDLLSAIADGISDVPVIDLDKITVSVDDLVAPAQVQNCIALAQQYTDLGYDPDPLFALMAELVCHDDQTEMHAYKLQQATFEEYHNTCEPCRWVHMVSAVKHAACIVQMHPKTVYPRAHKLLSS